MSAAGLIRQLGLFDSAAVPVSADVTVRRHRRARRLSLTVQPSGRVEVLAPSRTSDKTVALFVREHSAWIESTRRTFIDRFGEKDRRLPSRLALDAAGLSMVVRYESRQRPHVRTSRRGDTLVLSGPVADAAACRKALRRHVAGVARGHFTSVLDGLAAETGLGYRRLQVRAQRTCWGSRSSSGTISLNYCALFLRPPVVRYLALHELCHGRHMNHSRAFWSLVRSFEPNYRTLDRELADGWRELPGWLDLY